MRRFFAILLMILPLLGARLFDDASTEHLDASSAALTATPLSISCWIYTDATLIQQMVLGIGTAASGNNQWRLSVSSTLDRAEATTRSTSSSTATLTTPTVGTNTWHIITGTFEASDLSRDVYLDGSDTANNAGTRSISAPDVMSIGAKAGDATSPFSGRIAECGIWNIELTVAEVAQLSNFAPIMVRPDALLLYAPLVGKNDPETDFVGGASFTLVNTPSAAAHPPVFRPE